MVGRMPVVSRNRLRLREILQGCQFESGVSQWIKKLQDLYEVSNKSDFFEDLTHYLTFTLCNEERSKYVNRVLEVICQFGSSFLIPSEEKKDGEEATRSEEDEMGELPEFLSQLFHWLLDHHDLEGMMARLRICLMLNRLLKLMGENASILEDLFTKIYNNMQERLQDKVATIRGQAVTALQRLQDPSDKACPIIKAFVFHLSCDPSPIVRRTVIQVIAVTKSTLAHVIKRTKDVDDSVRLATYKTIAAKVHVRSMTIAQREDVLKRGFGDASLPVREVVKKDIIQAWLRHSKEDILKLLYTLDVENSNDPELSDATLDAIFEDVPNHQLLQQFSYSDSESKLVPRDKVTLEIVVYWRNLLKKFHEDGDHDNLEKIVPELSPFCKYVRSYVMESMKDSEEEEEKMGTRILILKQFILMMKYFDLSDEAGRGNLGHLMKDMLLSAKVSALLVPQIMEVYQRVCPNTQTRVSDIAEIIAEIREPMKDDADDIFDKSGDEMEVDNKGPANLSEDERRKKKMSLGKLRLEMNELRDELDRFIQERDFAKAQEIKNKMDELDICIKEIQEELSVDAIPQPSPQSVPSSNPEKAEDEPPKGDDPVLIHKCLEMIHSLMKDVKITTLNATLKTLLDEFIIPNIKNINFAIRQSAVRALGLCALRSVEDAKKYIVLLLRVACMDMVCVRVTSLSVINDFLMAYGLGTFAEDETRHEGYTSLLDMESLSFIGLENTVPMGGKDGNSIVSFLIRLLDDQDVEVRTKVVECLCKLQVFGSISSSKLFMRLMLIWFNPLTDNDGKMCHILGKFFPLYASLSRANQDVIAEAVFPTLECLWSAPVTSPLTRVNIEDVIAFFVRLTKDNILQNPSEIVSDSNIHDSLAESISNFIIDDHESEKARFLSKALTTLQLSPSNFTNLKELKVLHSRMISLVTDKASLKNLDRYGLNLDTWLSKNPNSQKEVQDEPSQGEESGLDESAMTTTTTSLTPGLMRKRTLLSQESTMYDSGGDMEAEEEETE